MFLVQDVCFTINLKQLVTGPTIKQKQLMLPTVNLPQHACDAVLFYFRTKRRESVLKTYQTSLKL